MSNIVRYNESNVTKQISTLIDELLDNIGRSPSFVWDRNWRPTEVKVEPEKYIIEIELPRVKKDEIKVEAVDGNTVTITAKTNSLFFERVFSYVDCSAEQSKVSLENGVLSVEIPRVSPKTKRLEIK